jgi:hypothetical protein
MRTLALTILLTTLAAGTCLGYEGFDGRPITENAFAETGYTLNKGEFAIGIGPMDFGISDRVQLGTNLLLWIVQYYNADLKVAVKKSDDNALSLGLNFGSLNLDKYNEDSDSDEEVDFFQISPYVAGSIRVSENTLWHVGGRYSHFEADTVDVDETEVTATASGTNIYTGIEHTYSNRTKFLADIAYDTTFEGMRVGGAVMFGWSKFRLKLGLSYLTAEDGFAWPIIGLWWRFDA